MVSYSYDAWGNIISKFFFKYGLANAKNPYTVTLGTTTYTAQDIDELNGFYYQGCGLWYGVEQFVVNLWGTRNMWKIFINYYL